MPKTPEILYPPTLENSDARSFEDWLDRERIKLALFDSEVLIPNSNKYHAPFQSDIAMVGTYPGAIETLERFFYAGVAAGVVIQDRYDHALQKISRLGVHLEVVHVVCECERKPKEPGDFGKAASQYFGSYKYKPEDVLAVVGEGYQGIAKANPKVVGHLVWVTGQEIESGSLPSGVIVARYISDIPKVLLET